MRGNVTPVAAASIVRLGGSGGGDGSRGGSIGASGACLTLGDVSPTDDSLFLRGGRGGGNRGLAEALWAPDTAPFTVLLPLIAVKRRERS